MTLTIPIAEPEHPNPDLNHQISPSIEVIKIEKYRIPMF